MSGDSKIQVANVSVDASGARPKNIEEAYRLASLVTSSKGGGGNPSEVLTQILKGMELGLTVFQSIDEIAIINGKPSVSAKAMLGIVRRSGLLDPAVGFEIEEKNKDYARADKKAGGDHAVVVTSKRVDEPKIRTSTFSLAEARSEGLVRGQTWERFTGQMLQWRCIARHIDRYFSDVMLGAPMTEVVQDARPPVLIESAPTQAPDPALANLRAPRLLADTKAESLLEEPPAQVSAEPAASGREVIFTDGDPNV